MTCHERSKQKHFEYVLEDYLGLKASLKPRNTRSLKRFLFSQRCKDFVLTGVEGFCLHPQLVLIGSKNPASFEHLVFLNPANGAIRVKRLVP